LPGWRRRQLRVGLGRGLDRLRPDTGHGRTWASVVAELRRDRTIKLVSRGRVDVWLSSGHAEPVDGRPLVVQVHEAAWREQSLRGLLDTEFAAGIDAATGVAVAAAAAVITPSEAARAQVIEVYGRAPQEVEAIHHGVDHAVFHPGLQGGRERIGAPYVLFVGVPHPRKNVGAVRQAVADLAAAGFEHKLAIVGNPAPDPRAESFIADAIRDLPEHPGRTAHFRSLPVHQLAALMAGADLLCLPSLFEGFGLPVLEAMACGTPVVVSDRGALPEVVGEGGVVVEPDAESVSRAVRRVVGDAELAARLRRAAAERAAGFSWARTAAGWADVLRRVA
jgi:glycosyltransferase involved in cell wall biosynthesis